MIRHSPRGLRGLALLGVLATGAAACGDDAATPTAPDPVAITVSFAGTLTPNDAETHPFDSQRGTVTATLLSVAPDSAAIVGFSLGTWNGLSCAAVISNDKAIQGISIVGTVNATGNLCVRMYDVGTIAEPLSYEVRVVHF